MSDTDTDTTTTLPAAIPFEEMTKDDQFRHIVDHHGMDEWRLKRVRPDGHRQTKDDLLRFHTKLHDETTRKNAVSRGQRGNEWITPLTHIHQAINIDGAAFDKETQTLNLAKPLTKSEAKTLGDLVNNDFDALASEMRQMAADKKRGLLEDYDKEQSLKKQDAESFRVEAERLRAEAIRQSADLTERARKAGFDLRVGIRTDYVQIEVLDSNAKRNAVTAQVDADLSRALLALDRQRLTAQRQILMATITPEATKILDEIPSAQALMVEAAKSRAAQEITS